MKLARRVGATSQIFQVFIQDSSSTTGAGLTGLAFNSGSLTAYYHRDTDTTATAISLVTMTVGTFTSSGFKEIDATNMPGWYQFCPPNAALASGAASVGLHLKGATNMAPLPIEVDLDAQVDVYLWNGTAVSSPATAGIPDINVKNINNVAAATPGAAGGLHINGSNAGTTTLAALTVTGSFTISDGLLVARSTSNASAITATGNGTGHGILATSGSGATGDGIKAVAASTNGNGVTLAKTGSGVDLNATSTVLTLAKTTNITGFNDIAASAVVSSGAITTSGGAVSTVTTVTNQLTAAAIATGVWQDATAGDFTTASSIGKSLYTSGVVPGGTNGLFIAGTNAATTITTALTTTFTGNVTGSVGSVTGAVASVTGNVGGNVTGSVASVVGAVGSVVGLTVSNLDAAITTRMATYTQPTGFLAATFPTTVASPTNITAGTITTATNLTNAPTAGDFTATMKTSIGTAVAASAVASVTAPVTVGTINSSASNIKKNTSVDLPFPMTDSTTHVPASGLTVTAQRSIDGAAFGACVNAVTEIGSGVYNIVLAAADTNGNSIMYKFTATGADQLDILAVTQP